VPLLFKGLATLQVITVMSDFLRSVKSLSFDLMCFTSVLQTGLRETNFDFTRCHILIANIVDSALNLQLQLKILDPNHD